VTFIRQFGLANQVKNTDRKREKTLRIWWFNLDFDLRESLFLVTNEGLQSHLEYEHFALENQVIVQNLQSQDCAQNCQEFQKGKFGFQEIENAFAKNVRSAVFLKRK
jgi:hypothetical protein